MKKNNFFINTVLFISSLLITFILLEFLVRLFLPQNIESPANFFSPDAILGWKLQPNLHRVFHSPDFETKLITNERGFRDKLHNYEKSNGTFRIVGLGDSFLFGWGVDFKDTVLFNLQKILALDGITTKKIETINLGVAGYNISQYYKILQLEGIKYKPDLVILFFYVDDWKEDSSYDYQGVTKDGFLHSQDRFSFDSIRSVLLPFRIFLKRNSQLYILVRDHFNATLKRKKIMAIPEIMLYRKDNDFFRRFSFTSSLIKEIRDFSEKNIGSRFIVCFIPDKIQVRESFRELVTKAYGINNNDYDWLQPQRIMANFCAENNIFLLDLTPAFSEREKNTPLYFSRVDIHWNKLGHLLAAEEICKYIRKRQIIR